MTSQPPPGEPPQAERPRSTTAILVASGVVLGAILLLILYTIRTGVPEEQTASTPTDDIPELIPPTITAGDFDATSDPLSADAQLELERGGWIQVPDPDDPQRLAQRYRCDRLDPNPEGAGPGWVEMTAPRAELHLSPRRIVTLVGESARVFLNNRAMESGRITGNVVIRMYESADEQHPPDLSGDPSLVIYTDDAELDNFLGEVTCRGDLFASTPTMDFYGRDLSLRISDRENRIESMTVTTPHWIRLTSDGAQLPGEEERAGAGRPLRIARAPHGTVADVAPYALPAMAASAGQSESASASPPAELDDVQFYKLTLSEDVTIRQGDDLTGRAAFGETLNVWFALQGREAEGLLGRDDRSPMPSDAPTRLAADARAAGSDGGRVLQVRPDPPGRPFDPRSIAGPPAEDDVYVTSRGPMRMTPAAETPPGMMSGDDTHLQLEGAPVRLYDYGDGIEASCGILRFETEADRFSLGSGHGQIVRIDSPQFDLLADFLEVRQTDARAELDGPGEMMLRRDTEAGAAGAFEQLRITWEQGVELEFRHESDDEAGAGEVTMRRLDRAIFDGDVAVVSDDFDLRSAHLDVGFRADGEESDDIESIFARGEVEARTARDQSTLVCDELRLEMIPDADGRSAPSRLEATGAVRAAGEQGTLWTPHLLVHFFDPDDPDRPARDETDGEGDLFSDAAVRTVEAGDTVQIRLTDGQRVFADRLFADAELETLELTGEDVMLLADTAWIDRTQRLVYHDGDGTARLDGPGRLQFLESGLVVDDDGPIDPPELAGDSTVTWQDGVDMTFSEPDDAGASRALRAATFAGDVDVRTPDFRMTSATMDVHFRGEADDADDIETIIARGDVRAVAEHDEGVIDCDELQVDLEPDLLGRAAPARMIATGRVVARGEEGVLWTQRLVAQFVDPKDPDRLDAGRARDARDDAAPADRLGGAEIRTITAEDGVQLRLAEGERVYAERLFADAEQERVELTGENVQMFVDNAWVDRGRRVVFYEADRTARFDGPGRLRMMDDPVQPAAFGPVDPPVIDGEPRLLAQWYESMFFDELANDGGGFVRLVGDVLVTSELHDEQSRQFEQRRITGHVLELDLVRTDQSEGTVERDAITGGGTDERLGGRRDVRRLVAQGSDDALARIDALAWPDAARQEEPRILSVRGRHIDHDAETQHSTIDGAGVLVVHDLSEERDEEGDRFAGRGTTRFQWRDSLEMTREMADLHRVVMVGDVQVEHQSIDGEVATLTSRRLRASIVQDEPAGASSGADAGRDHELVAASGSSRLRRLIATEDVFIRTPEYDVDCDEFDYDVATALAVLSSETSRGVSVHRRSTGQSFNHHRARWFMDETNRIIIDRGGAGVGN